MYTLGISYTGAHDSAVCLVRDDEVVFATAEERLSRQKHDPSFPLRSIHAALNAAGIQPTSLAGVGLAWPRFDVAIRHDLWQMLTGSIPVSRWSMVSLALASAQGIRERSRIKPTARTLGPDIADRIHLFSHHRCHALSAAAVSGFPRAAVLVVDGRGAKLATSIWRADGPRLTLVEGKFFPDSLGLFYARITQYLGFEPLSDEWKVMGLAAYGRPGVSMDKFVRVSEDDYEVNGRALLGRGQPDLSALEAAFGPARAPDAPITDHHRDVAFAAQEASERAMLALARRAARLTGCKRLCLAGGVALNCKANGLILQSGLVDDLFVQPAAADDGAALGAAVAAQQTAGGIGVLRPMTHAYLGQQAGDAEVESELRTYKVTYRRADNPAEAAAELLAQRKVIGWFQGRAEFGPRALGNRSILADPRDVAMRDRVNAAVKFREEWRPFAPSVLEEHAGDYFEGCTSAPFMILTFRVRPEVANRIPAVVHADGTARVQTVNRTQNPLYWSLIKAFADRTGVPVVMNTSFNLKGDPIVNTVRNAIATFYTSGLDALVLGRYILEK